jgi:hypothetical protein
MGINTNGRVINVFFAGALAAYFVSFLLPVFDNTQMHHDHMSLAPSGLVMGWQAFVLSLAALLAYCPAGLANPSFWLGCLFFVMGWVRASLAASALGLVLGLSALLLLVDSSLVHRQQYLLGYYVWLGSFVLLALASLRDSRA